MNFSKKTFGALLFASLLFSGCAGSSAPRTAGVDSTTPAAPPLETVRPSLHTLEDSLVLDILLGYQQITAGKSDREVLRRARSAQNQLDYMLRHGGVKDRGGEGRVIEIPAGEKASLGELTSQMSRELLGTPTGESEAERAREVRRHRRELSFLVEDAEWVLTLQAALESSLSEDDKRSLRRLQEAYSNRAPHSLVASQVTALLQTVKEERLRKELKKLANRSWEREKKVQDPTTNSSSENKKPKSLPPVVPPPALPTGSSAPLPDFDATPEENATPIVEDSTAVTPADTLTSPDRYCEERRAEAADAFASARAATGEARTALLRQSLAALDECLKRYPDSKGAEKARGNRDRVQKELQPKQAQPK